jgi:hypothetical protein
MADHAYPSYSTPGRILVLYHGPAAMRYGKHECEVLDHDYDTSVFYIGEGMGMEYWLDEHIEFPAPGHYVIEGIKGEYIKGDWGFTEDDEEWEFASIRPATADEIASGELPEREEEGEEE